MNKNVTKYIFPYRAFPTEHDCDVYFHVQFFFLQKLEGLLQHHVSPFISPSPVLSQYIQFYEVRRNIKKKKKAGKYFNLLKVTKNTLDKKNKQT